MEICCDNHTQCKFEGSSNPGFGPQLALRGWALGEKRRIERERERERERQRERAHPRFVFHARVIRQETGPRI